MDPSLIAAAVVLVISSVGGTVVLIINAASASKDRREAASERLQQLIATQESNRKSDTIIQSTARIHELTNSTNSNLQKALELMTEKVAGLEKLIAELREAKRDAAQAVRDRYAEGSASPISAADETLGEIETNTAETAKGVQNLKKSK